MNRELLDYEIKRNGYTTRTFCEKIGMPVSTFYKKCRGLTEFKLSEMKLIVDVLHLESPVAIFFST